MIIRSFKLDKKMSFADIALVSPGVGPNFIIISSLQLLTFHHRLLEICSFYTLIIFIHLFFACKNRSNSIGFKGYKWISVGYVDFGVKTGMIIHQKTM
jgi:hypothetical protein